MTPAEAQLEIVTLRAEVARHQALYDATQPEIGDYEFDRLKRRLADLEREFPQFASPDSPTQLLGDDRSEGFTRAKHRQAMTTLDNTYEEEELRDFHARLVKLFGRDDLLYSVEPKIDGASISLTYEHGILVRAVTRGDGEEGDDVTANVRTISNLPQVLRSPEDLLSIPVPSLVEIRGEVFLRYAEFDRINQEQVDEGLAPYANPRNLAAGTLKLLDATAVKERALEIVLYGLGACDPESPVQSQKAWHATLAQWGLPTLEHRKSVCGIEEVLEAIRSLDAVRDTLPYATDGAVVKLDDFELQRRAGFRGEGQSARKLSPRWACAYKFAPERAETKLKSITIQVGRTGVLTPVAELEPVQLAGTTVSRATLHNRDEITRKDIRIGDTVTVEKAGEIIPAVIGVTLTRRPPNCMPYVFPGTCPVCSTAVVQVDGEVAVRCPNPDCPAQLTGRLDYVASRTVLDLEGLGGVVAERLVETGVVTDIFDLFSLQSDTLAKLILSKDKKLLESGKERKPTVLGEKNAQKIIAAIQRARSQSLSRWILAMQIRDVGGATSQDLARISYNLEGFFRADVVRKIAALSVMLGEIQDTNPNAAANRAKSDNEKEALRQKNDQLVRAADALGEWLIHESYARYSEKPLYESIPIGESQQRIRFESLQRIIREKEKLNKTEASHSTRDQEIKNLKRELTELATDMIAEGLAVRSKNPPRYALSIIGPVVARYVLEWIEGERGRRFWLRAKELGIDPVAVRAAPVATPLSGKVVVVTGSMEESKLSRGEVQDLIRKLGGIPSGSISRKTDLLVVGTGGGSKLDDAKRLGIRVLSESEFLKIAGLSLESPRGGETNQAELL